MKLFLLSGAHGVGKGFFLKRVKYDIQDYEVLSASGLIERHHTSTDAGYKKVSNVDNNQDVLIRAINEEKKNNKKNIILDGHLCVFNAEGKVERIPEYFFIQAGITGIILLQDDSKRICDRIKHRDLSLISQDDIEQMQNEEQKYAEELKEKYHIDYMKITHEWTGEQFSDMLRENEGDSNE